MNDPEKGNKSEQRTALWTLILSLSTIALTICTAGVFWYAVLQSVDVKQSLQIARQAMIGDQRPWISGPTAFYDNGSVRLVFKNAGKTPTTGLYINGDVVDSHHWFTILKEKCAEADRHTRADEGFRNYSITPGGEHVLHDLPPDDPFSKADIAQRLRGSKYVIGCVIYGIPFDKERHRTGFAIPIDNKDDGSVSFGETSTLMPN